MLLGSHSTGGVDVTEPQRRRGEHQEAAVDRRVLSLDHGPEPAAVQQPNHRRQPAVHVVDLGRERRNNNMTNATVQVPAE